MTAHSSPHKASLQGHDQFSARQHDADTRRVQLVKEMSGQYVGPMPIDQFIDFLPKAETPAPHLDCSQVPQVKMVLWVVDILVGRIELVHFFL